MASIFTPLVLLLCLYVTQQQTTYACSVPNCQVCTYLNFCGLCNPGYIMEISASTGQLFCNPVSCNVTFCTTCLANNTCEICNTNYQPTVNGQCQPIPSQQPTCIANCLVCYDSLTCLSCSYGYTLLQNGICAPAYPLPQACLVAMSSYPSICQICQPNTALTPNLICQSFTPNQVCTPNCIVCNTNNNICIQCQPQYFLTSSNQCLPNTIPNCQQYTNSNYTTCQQCTYGFILINGSCVQVAFGCDIDNCSVCYQPNGCYICQENFVPLISQGFEICLPAQQINSMYGPSLMVPGCRVFYPLNLIPSSVELPQTSNYNPLCIECQPGFALIGGMCTLTSPYLCNVANCKNCSFNNYCGICEVGYGAREGLCYKLYSPLPGCLITAKYSVSCQTCQEGYVNIDSFCYPNNNSITCKVYGCQYCSTNNTCIQCQNYFNPVYVNSSLTCQSNCTAPGCFQCYGNGSCSVCLPGYFINYSTRLCESGATTCQNIFGVGCVECTLFGQCFKCASNYSLFKGKCCLSNSSMPSIVGCLFANPCQPQCLLCYPGYYLSSEGLCLALPCALPNCLYCFETSTCIVCDPQYRLDPVQRKCVFNGQYLSCRTPQNPYCTSCFNSTCNSCDSGTTLIGGQCYCDIPGCISCMGSLFCIQCAYPLQSDPTTGGCVPPPKFNSICQVQNCGVCNKPTVCSICSPGYSLNQQNQCVINNCASIPNCNLCDSRQAVCYSCNSQYALSGYSGNTCAYLPQNYQCNSANCALCQSQNPTLCQVCFQTYYLQQGLCLKVPCSTGCQYCFVPNSCIACNLDYQLTPYGGCTPRSNPISCGIQYCIQCNSLFSCGICLPGYQINANGLCAAQSCLAMNCRICQPNGSGACLICQQGYYLNSYQQCLPYSPTPQISSCNIPKCLQCYIDNLCAVCLPSFQVQSNQCVYNSSHCLSSLCTNCTQTSYCYHCITGYYPLAGSCVFNQSNCSDLNCLTCFSYMDCEACKSGYMRQISGGNGVCRVGWHLYGIEKFQWICSILEILFFFEFLEIFHSFDYSKVNIFR